MNRNMLDNREQDSLIIRVVCFLITVFRTLSGRNSVVLENYELRLLTVFSAAVPLIFKKYIYYVVDKITENSFKLSYIF